VAKKLIWTTLARADVRAIDRQTALCLLESLARFLINEEGDVSRLTDIDPPEYRLRIGDYRVRFYDHGDSLEILRVRHRREVYR
jgi:mRNA-degrading endonuclease RelE of RelBE toxin-antitoxin system